MRKILFFAHSELTRLQDVQGSAAGQPQGPHRGAAATELVARAGAPGRVIVPYTIHAVVKFFVDNLVPEGTLDDMTAAEMKMLIEEAQKSSTKAT